MSDYIKREDAIRKLVTIINESDMPEDWHRGLSVAISNLYRVPSADVVEVRHSKWIRHENPRYEYDRENGYLDAGVSYTCLECGEYGNPSKKFCSNCGADMRERKDEEFDSLDKHYYDPSAWE